MVSDKDSGTAQRQLCPFCGKSFKRLKTHLPHCKMAPVAKETESSEAPLETCSSILEHTFTKSRTTAPKPEGLLDTNLTEIITPISRKTSNTHVSLNKVVTKVSQTKKISSNNCPKSDLSSTQPQVKAKTKERLRMTTEDPDNKNTPGGARDAVSEQRVKRSISLKAGDHSRAVNKIKNCESTPKKGQLRTKTSKIKVQQIWMPSGPLDKVGAKVQHSLPGSWASDIGKAKAAERSFSAQEIPNSRPTSVEYHVWHHGTKTSVWDHIKVGLTGKSGRHLTADLKEAALRVEPTFKRIEPQSSLVQAVQAELLHKQRPENLFARVSDDSAFYHYQTSALREPRRQGSAAGLEWTPDLGLAYRSIGFSMLPLQSITKHVQGKSLPVQPIVQQVQGNTTERPFLELRLMELPAWVMSQPLPRPRQAWQWYHRKYISGVAMLLAGYCVLSYVWSYPPLKEHKQRRKYH